MSMTSKIAIYLLITLCTTNTNGLHSLTGNVEAGNYSYYVLKVDGPILLQLETIGKGPSINYVSNLGGRGGSKSSYFCLLLLMFLPILGGGGVKKVQKSAYVVYEWSLTKFRLNS